MYCKNCGTELNNNAAVCLTCGCAVGTGTNHCSNCGAATAPNAVVCTSCGVALNVNNAPAGGSSAKSKTTAGLLAIFLGTLGIHNFYLGYTQKAVIQLIVSIVGSFLFGLGAIAVWIWAIVEAVQIFQGKITDAKGLPLTN